MPEVKCVIPFILGRQITYLRLPDTSQGNEGLHIEFWTKGVNCGKKSSSRHFERLSG
jgi:hypothetical protein